MAESLVDPAIADFAARFEKEISISEVSEIDPLALARFNKELYADQFNAARYSDERETVAFWSWKYGRNPAAVPSVGHGWVASHRDQLIGQFRVIPADVKIGARSYRCAWGSDLAILKQYRNLGVSALLIRHARAEVAKEYAAFLLGGMNFNSYGVFKKSGFLDLGTMPRYIRILDAGAILERQGTPKVLAVTAGKIARLVSGSFPPVPAGITVERTASFGSEFDLFWNTISKRFDCIARRDAAFLAWRYVDQPLWVYTAYKAVRGREVAGYICVREGEIRAGRMRGLKIGVVADLLVDPEDRTAAGALIGEALRFFAAKRPALVRCDVLHGALGRMLTSAGFFGVPPANEFMVHIHPNHLADADAARAALRGSWLVSSGDSDLDFE